MCGLVGFLGKANLTTEKAFKDLLRVDVIRGPHSTGVALIDGANKSQVVKGAILPDHLFDHKTFKKAFSKGFKQCYIGHNRYATMGVINNKNAHPFRVGSLIGAHNGTIRDQWRLDNHLQYDVDSENIYFDINKNGVDKTYTRLNGAVALTWWDTTEKKLKMLRNRERPLHYTLTNNEEGLFWASEPWMLKGVLERHNIKHGDIEELPPHNVHTWSLQKLKGDKKEVIYLAEEELTPFTHPIVRNTYYGGGAEYPSWGSRAPHFSVGGDQVNKGLHQGTRHNFNIIHQSNTNSGAVLLHCEPTDFETDDNLYIRIQPSELTMYKRLIESTDDLVFSGSISYVTYEGVGKHSIKCSYLAVGSVYLKTDKLVNGVLMTRKKFEEKYHLCMWCNNDLEYDDSDGMIFCKEDEVMCPNCASDKELVGYMGSYNVLI
jgi:predicted glutamine amidotransferase